MQRSRQKGWKEALTEELSDDDTESSSSNEGKFLFYVSLFFEIAGMIFLAISAIYLRFFPVQTFTFIPSSWISSSNDTEYSRVKGSQEYVIFFYATSLLIPVVLITIEELERCSLPKSRFTKSLNNSERLIERLPKYGRFMGMFILGVFLTSLTVDYLKLLVSRPRPYILTEYKEIGTNLSVPFTNDVYVTQSFPSHVAAVVSYCCMFSSSYCYVNKIYEKTPSLLIIVTQCFFLLTATACTDRFKNNFSHKEDIIVGFIIGIVFAVYICYHVSLISKEALSMTPDYSKFPALPRISLPPQTVEAVARSRRHGSTTSLRTQSDNRWNRNFY